MIIAGLYLSHANRIKSKSVTERTAALLKELIPQSSKIITSRVDLGKELKPKILNNWRLRKNALLEIFPQMRNSHLMIKYFSL